MTDVIVPMLSVIMMLLCVVVMGVVVAESITPYRHARAQRIQIERQIREERRAHNQARALFETVLQPHQIVEYDRRGYITVTSPSGRSYQVSRHGTPVYVLCDGVRSQALCLVSSEPLPPLDLVVQNVLLLEAGEDLFLQEANLMALMSAYG